MMNVFFSEVPSELDFLVALGVEPLESDPSDGFWVYRFESESNIALILSFNQHARSIQTSLFIGEQELSTVSHEGLESLRIEAVDGESRLVGICKAKGERAEVVIAVYPIIRVRWASLRSE